MTVPLITDAPVPAGEQRSPRRAARAASLVGLGFAAALAGVLLWCGAANADIFAGFSDSTLSVAPGDTFTVYVQVLQAGAQFNAFDASIRFDPGKLTFEPTSPVSQQRGPLMMAACSNTFHNFSAVASDSLKITLSLLCSNTFVTGPGTIYRVRFRASTTPGVTTLTFGPYTEFYRAGLFARPVFKRPLQITIGTPAGVPERPTIPGLAFATPAPNPRRGSSASVLDFTLPIADVVSIDVVDLLGRRAAAREPERFESGRHRLSWSPPALPPGEYLVRLHARSSGDVVRKWTVLR